MTENEMIEEMAKVMCGNDCEECAKESAEFYKQTLEEARNNPCLIKNCAKTLYQQGYRKIPEGSVVLDRHEHQKYCAYKIIEPQIRGCLDRERELERKLAVKENDIGKLESKIDDLKHELKQARKETAKEILSLAIKHDNGYETDMTRFVSDLKKQYGVEE